jgi:hypothetical protein
VTTPFKRPLALAAGLIVALLSSRVASAQNVAPPPIIEIPQCNGYRLQTDDPLTAKQRACIWGGNLLTPGAVFGAAFSSGYGLLTKEEPAWGQGTAGYAKLFGARYAQGMTKATGEYLTAWAFHEDPRRKPTNCITWKRAVCAARNMFAQPKEGGGYRPVFSTVAGAAAGGFIGMSFYPNTGTVNESLRRSGTSLATSLLSFELTEFEPDILHLVGRLFAPKSTAKEAFATGKEKR